MLRCLLLGLKSDPRCHYGVLDRNDSRLPATYFDHLRTTAKAAHRVSRACGILKGSEGQMAVVRSGQSRVYCCRATTSSSGGYSALLLQ